MPTFELFSLIVVAALAWLWFDSFQAREAAIGAARKACQSEQLQLLDETVVIASLKPVRHEDGQLMWRRVYKFEYSDTGNNRRPGSLVLLGHRVVVINIGLRLVNANTTLH